MKIDLELVGTDRVFNLKCLDDASFATWKARLSHSLAHSTGTLKQLTVKSYYTDIDKFQLFWRFLRITEEAFQLQTEIGDLILC